MSQEEFTHIVHVLPTESITPEFITNVDTWVQAFPLTLSGESIDFTIKFYGTRAIGIYNIT